MDWLSENAWAAWAGLAALLGVAELFSLDLVLLMLAVGAGAGAVAAGLGASTVVAFLVASVTAVGMLALVRPNVVKKLHSGPDLKHGPAALVGQDAFVIDEVSARDGRIKLAGEVWTARPYDDHAVIPPGARVQVFEIRGATAYVHEVPELGA